MVNPKLLIDPKFFEFNRQFLWNRSLVFHESPPPMFFFRRVSEEASNQEWEGGEERDSRLFQQLRSTPVGLMISSGMILPFILYIHVYVYIYIYI